MKYAVPGIFVVGASKDIDPITMSQNRDHRGRHLWNMPKPSGQHKTKQMIQVKRDGKLRKVKQVVMVPVYRGVSASLARYYRSQIKRARRFAAERAAAESADG